MWKVKLPFPLPLCFYFLDPNQDLPWSHHVHVQFSVIVSMWPALRVQPSTNRPNSVNCLRTIAIDKMVLRMASPAVKFKFKINIWTYFSKERDAEKRWASPNTYHAAVHDRLGHKFTQKLELRFDARNLHLLGTVTDWHWVQTKWSMHILSNTGGRCLIGWNRGHCCV